MRSLLVSAVSLAISCGGNNATSTPDGGADDPEGGLTSFFDRVRHIVAGTAPRQHDVDLDALDPSRVIRIFGYVEDDSGAPMPGVRVELLSDEPSPFGWTLTQDDGRFDFLVHSAPRLVVRYQKEGFLESQRLVRPTKPNEHVAMPRVMLVPLDPAVTTFRAGEPTVARGTPVDDGDGRRQATLLFPSGLSAAAEMPDGRSVPLTTLSVRATEYTVGVRGPARMPGTMPRQIAYTYAVELSVDEANAMGADSVTFDRPVLLYLENFLGMPVGGVVPTGYYDRRQGEWLAVDDGRIVAVVGRRSGLALLDVDGDGAADPDPVLESLGIDNDERQNLAALYADGAELWRVPVRHFSPYDCNWPYRLPGDARTSSFDPTALATRVPCPTAARGSIIECENQDLAEEVPVLGTGFTLRYSTDGVPGNRDAFTVRTPLLAPSDVTPSLQRIDVRSVIEGQLHERSGRPEDFTLRGAYFDEWVWDGLDADGKRVGQPATVWNEVCLVYRGLPIDISPEDSSGASFGALAATGATISVDRVGMEASICRTSESRVGVWDSRGAGLLGWTLKSLPLLDREAGAVLGVHIDAANREPRGFTRIAGFAGGEEHTRLFDGAPAMDTVLEARALMRDDHERLVFVSDNHGIWRIEHDGTLSLWPGTEEFDSSVLWGSNGITLGQDGSLYLFEQPGHVSDAATLSRISPDGERTLLAGGVSHRECCGVLGCGAIMEDRIGDGGDPRAACLGGAPSHRLGAARDGSILFIHDNGRRLRRYGRDGRLSTVVLADETDVLSADGTALGRVDRFKDGPWITPEGRIWLLGATDRFSYTFADRDVSGAVLLELREDGSLIALSAFDSTCNTDRRPNSEEQRTAALTDVCFYESGLDDIEWGPDGSVYFLFSGRTLHQLRAGRLRHIAGSYSVFARTQRPSEDEDLEQFPLDVLADFEVLPNGDVVVISSFFFGFDLGSLAGSFQPLYVVGKRGPRFERDTVHASVGGADYAFSTGGLPLRRTSRFVPTAETRFLYGPAPEGVPGVRGDVLTGIVLPDGNTLRIERPSNTHVVLIAPFGEETHLHDDDGDGYADRVHHEGAADDLSFSYGTGPEEGLLEAMVDRAGTRHEFTYDQGRLVRDALVGLGTQTLTLEPPRYTAGAFRYAVERTSAEGYITRYEALDVGPLRSVERRQIRRVVHPDGTVDERELTSDGVRVRNRDGSVAAISFGSDPLGEGPAASRAVLSTPGGRHLEVAVTHDVEFATDGVGSVERWSETRVVAPGSAREAAFTRTFASDTREWTIMSAEGRSTRWQLDHAGRVVRMELPGQHPRVLSYDDRGRLERIGRGDGSDRRELVFTHGPNSRLPEQIEDGVSRITQSFDTFGRVTARTDALGNTSSFDYDESSRTVTFAGNGGAVHTLEFDPLGELSVYTPPAAADSSGPWSVARDGDGVLDMFSLGDGRAVTLHLDEAGRPSRLMLARGERVTTYDPDSGRIDTVAMPTRAAGSEVIVDFDFDGPLLVRQEWSGAIAGEVAFDYDERWQLRSLQVGAEPPVTYTYDLDGLVTSAGPLVVNRNPNDGSPSLTSVGAMSTEFSFDGFGAAVRQAATWPRGGFSTEVTSVDAAGRVGELLETSDSSGSVLRYDYDDAGRLTHVQRDGHDLASYEYDGNGNRISWRDERGETVATYDAQDRLLETSGALSRSYRYNAHGQVETWTSPEGTTRLEFDELGQLLRVELPDAREITYESDGLGRRVARSVDGVRTHVWLYRDDRLIAELDNRGNVQALFVYATSNRVPDLMLSGGRTFRLVRDRLGSIRRVVDAATGEVVQAIDYDPYGRVLRDTNPGLQPFGYAAGLYDPLTGLVRFGAREYDAEIGRWLAKDPLLVGGGDTNLYAYVAGDPINGLDPTGLWYLKIGAEAFSGFVLGGKAGAGVYLGTDECGQMEFGLYTDAAVSGGARIEASLGLAVSFSPGGNTTTSLPGDYVAAEVSAEAVLGGSIEVSAPASGDLDAGATGFSAGIGVGGGASLNVGTTTTYPLL